MTMNAPRVMSLFIARNPGPVNPAHIISIFPESTVQYCNCNFPAIVTDCSYCSSRPWLLLRGLVWGLTVPKGLAAETT